MEITQESAIVQKACKLVAHLHTHNRNLTALQNRLVDDLWDVATDWDYVEKHLADYNLNCVRNKED